MLSKLSIRSVLRLLAVAVPLSAALADPVPLESFADLPEIEGARLSPDGKAVAMISPRDGRQGVRIWHADGQVDWYMPAGDDQLNWVAWKGNERVLMSLRASEFEPGAGSRLVGVSRLVFIDLASHASTRVHFRDRLPPEHIIIIGREAYRPPNVQDRVISLLSDDPHHILLAAADDWAHANALEVDVRDGSPSVLMRSADSVVKWTADAMGKIRLKTTVEHHDEMSALAFWVRDNDHGDWRVIHRYELDHGPRFIPLSFSPRIPSALLVLADQADGRLALQEVDTRTGTPGTVLASDPQCDIEPVQQDSQVIGYSNPCLGPQEVYFDEGWQKDQAVLRRALKTDLVEIVDRTPDGGYALVKSMASATAPPVFWYFDQSVEHSKILIHIGTAPEALKPDMLASTRMVSLISRDGLALPALLTLPSVQSEGPMPFVVLPHGGPTAHDSVQYEWIVQFIASRGYGVLQPQFRGSTGYGADFQRAGYRQWGGKMQDDVTDATRWLIQQKLADPKRLCIVGSSYGGYSALIGAARNPGLYRCVAAIAPVTDMARLMRDRDHSEFGDVNHSRVLGNMESAGVPSPVNLAADITAPVLLIHGLRDFTVPVTHSQVMAESLIQAGRKPSVVYLKDTDHFFSNADGRRQVLAALEAFLAANLSAARTPGS